MIKNKYEGHIQDLMFNPGGGALTNAYTFFTAKAAALQPGVDATNGLVANNAGTYTFAQVEGAGHITAAQRAQLEGGLLALGYSQTSIDAMTISTANDIYNGAQTKMNGGAALTSDKIVEAEQTGSGFTPIVSVDLSLLEGKLGIALKYEHLTKMEVKNKTTRDDVGKFPNDSTTTADLPGFLSVGVRYNATDKLKVQAGFHYYMDKAARYGVRDNGEFCTNGTEVTDDFDGTKKPYIKSNSTEFALGLEYAITEKFGASAGYLYASTNPNNVYQSDMNYSLKSSTVGFGVFAKATEKLNINLGFSYTMYQDYTKPFGVGGVTAYSETYKKSATLIALGLDYRFGK
jgi:long-subunit fatty acid transport protein